MVFRSKRKPDYGMQNLDSIIIMEERMANKLELVGPMMDSYLNRTGTLILTKLARSKTTGLMPPVNIFIPWPVFQHICVLVLGYGGDMKTSDRTVKLTITSYVTAKKVFSPVRMKGTNCLKKRMYKRVKDNGKLVSKLKGRAAVMVTEQTPIV